MILMQIIYSKNHTPLRMLKKNLDATYARLKHGHISTLSSRCNMPALERKERILYLLSHYVTIRFAVRAHNVVLCFWRSLNIACIPGFVTLSFFPPKNEHTTQETQI